VAQPVADPRMTVVVMTRDRRPELVRTLDRMTALPERPTVIVVDNASSDGSPEAAERYRYVRVIRAATNLGAPLRPEGPGQCQRGSACAGRPALGAA
jgi:hypothetical protein